jgi:hypothetical protein
MQLVITLNQNKNVNNPIEDGLFSNDAFENVHTSKILN